MIISVVALVVAIGAAGCSLWAAVSNHRMAQATDRLARADGERREEERADRDRDAAAMRRADLRLRWDSSHLVVVNGGPAKARRVGVEPVAVWGGGGLPQLLDTSSQPFDLGPGESTALLLPQSKDVAAEIDCQMVWEDDEGPHTERRRVRRS